MSSLYWDDFEKRIEETVTSILKKESPKVRRVAVFITDVCNFHCKYCNSINSKITLSEERFKKILTDYGKDAIIHITGGEPSKVSWLYPLLEKESSKYRFHLNTNAYITPPSKAIKRLKISFDSNNPDLWNKLVGKKNAFERVVSNIKVSIPNTVVSLTCTLTKQNYKDIIDFTSFVNKEFPGLYALFFSIYKGNNPEYIITKKDGDIFFAEVLPELKKILPKESLSLIEETLDEKKRLIQGKRFPENKSGTICYLSMSERVISSTGKEYTCSHLFRDNIFTELPIKYNKCIYGCNRRLVKFNEEVERILEKYKE